MQDGKRRWLFLVVIFSLLTFTDTASADLYWESESVSQAMPGRGPTGQIIKNYLTPYASRTEMGDQIMIMNFDDMNMYTVDPASKSYSVMNMNQIGHMGGMSSEDSQMMQAMMKNMMQSIQVTPTGEKKKIAGYNCSKYNVSMMMVNSEYWVSDKVEGYHEMKTMGTQIAKKLSHNPILKQMNMAALMDQLDGFPVQVITHAMGGTQTITLKKTQKGKLDKKLFEVPSGYRQTALE
jgi:hypothetical protein